jgi:hypothetical protein
MAESFYTELKVGGSVTRQHVKDILEIINENFDDGTFEEINAIKDKQFTGSGAISYEKFEEIEAALLKLNVAFTLTMYPKDDYRGIKCYNFPDVNLTGETDSDGNGHSIIRISEIKPLINLMLDFIKEGNSTLAKHINNETTKDLVTKMLSDPDDLIPILEKELNQVLPELPKIPKLIIK